MTLISFLLPVLLNSVVLSYLFSFLPTSAVIYDETERRKRRERESLGSLSGAVEMKEKKPNISVQQINCPEHSLTMNKKKKN